MDFGASMTAKQDNKMIKLFAYANKFPLPLLSRPLPNWLPQ